MSGFRRGCCTRHLVTKLPLLYLIASALALILLACQLPYQFFATATPTASLTSTSTPTKTLRPTRTPRPTITPTSTTTPTPTLIPITVQPQENGTTVIIDPAYGYQFLLPSGWEPTHPKTEKRISAIYSGNAEDSIDLSISVSDTRNLENTLEKRTKIAEWGFGFTIIKKEVATNGYNTTLAFLEYKGTFGGQYEFPVHDYYIFFVSNGKLVTFLFHIDESLHATAQQAISTIQGSIQSLNP